MKIVKPHNMIFIATALVMGMAMFIGILFYNNQFYAQRVLDAIRQEDIEQLKILVASPLGNLNSKPTLWITEVLEERTEPTPLQAACKIGNLEIVEIALFAEVQKIRAARGCRANNKRFNLFRGKLFCQCCGHPLAISSKQLLSGKTDIYLCMHHYHRPDVCPQTHQVYHTMLYPYVLQQIRQFASSMKKRKVNSQISEFTTLEELTPRVLDAVIERIEIGHIKHNSSPGRVIHIRWKLK